MNRCWGLNHTIVTRGDKRYFEAVWENQGKYNAIEETNYYDVSECYLHLSDLVYNTNYAVRIRSFRMEGENRVYSPWSKMYQYNGEGEEVFAHYREYYLNFHTPIVYVPEVLKYVGNTTNSITVGFDLTYTAPAEGDRTLFTPDENGLFYADRLMVKAVDEGVTVPAKWQNYELTAEDKERRTVTIDGLTPGCYNIWLADSRITPAANGYFNVIQAYTGYPEADPNSSVLIPHECNPSDPTPGAAEMNACCLDDILIPYMDAFVAENQIFDLEGGKTYYIKSNIGLTKGFTLRTRPEDAARGLRAKVIMGDMVESSNQAYNFMLGSQEKAPIAIRDIVFDNIDFSCPFTKNYGAGTSTGNYFISMYSSAPEVNIRSLQIKNCTFSGFIRGFLRVQGVNAKVIDKFDIDGNLFYNCGYYDKNGRGYAWIAGDGSNVKSNIYKDFRFTNNTIYDSPRTSFLTDNNKSLEWGSDIQYNITIENNTFVNFSTRTSGRYLIDMRYLPGGSKIVMKKNLFALAADGKDTRDLYQCGMDIRQVKGSGKLTLDFADNYSVGCRDTHLKNDGIFTGNAFSSAKNSGGTFPDALVSGNPDDLVVKVGSTPLMATDLFTAPNPPYLADPAEPKATDHQAPENIMEALKYKQTPEVLGHEIYTLGIGDPRWRK